MSQCFLTRSRNCYIQGIDCVFPWLSLWSNWMELPRNPFCSSNPFCFKIIKGEPVSIYYTLWYHRLLSVTPNAKSTVIQAQSQGESSTINLSPGNARVQQPKSRCVWVGSHSFFSSSMEVPSPCSPQHQETAITVHIVHSTEIFFCHVLYRRLHFRTILKTPLLQKIISIQCHFSDLACLYDLR